MEHQTVMDLLNASVLPAWALLIVAPRWRWTKAVVQTGLYPVVLGLAYIALIVASVRTGQGGDIDFTTIEGITAIFSHPLGVLTAWAHFLVLDLFAGMWEARDAEERGVPWWALAPCLLLTFIAGPAGLLLYFVLRRKWRIESAAVT